MRRHFMKLMAFVLAIAMMASAVPGYAATYRPGAQSGPSSSYQSGKYYNHYLQVPITGDNRTDLIAVALSQLGYQEGAANGYFSGMVSGGSNYVEFSYNMGDLGLGYGGSDYPWCASFVSWCLYQSRCTNHATYSTLCRYHSGDYNYIWKEISCAMWVNQLKGAGYFSYSASMGGSYVPQYGDLVFFKSSSSPSHIGICLYVKNGVLYTVEGNTSDASGLETNGGGVYFKSYSLASTYLYGYGRLPYVSNPSVQKIDYSGENPTPGLYISNAAKYIYDSETATTYTYVIPRFSMFEITRVGSNNRLYGTFINTAGQTCTGWIENNSSRIIQISASNVISGSWHYDGVGYKYQYSDGTFAAQGWLKEPTNGAWYYIGADGYAAGGWLYLDTGTFYLDPNSKAMLTGHLYIDGIWHYFNSDGYLCDGDWVSDGVGYMFRFVDGTYAINCWVDDPRNNYARYYLDTSGHVVCGWQKIGENTYYFDPNYHALLRGWLYIDNNWYYMDSSTGAMQTGWIELDGAHYYLNPSTGAMATGTQDINGSTCTFDESGKLVSGTIIEDTETVNPTPEVDTSGGNGYDSYTGGMPANGLGSVYAEGIDISKWNNGDDWSTLKLNLEAVAAAGCDFVIIRCGSTNKGKDPMFEKYYAECKRLGLDVGVYFYTYALDAATALSDAKKCLSYIEGKQLEYPVYLDFEDPTHENISGTLAATICKTFLDAVAEEGYLTGIYSYKSWLERDWVTNSGIRSKYEAWAAYPVKSQNHALYDVEMSQKFGMYQYTFEKVIPNAGTFDANVCYKDYPSIVKSYGFNNYGASSKLSASWVQDENGFKYQYSDGSFASAGWLYDESCSAWYYLDANGYAVSGWVEDNGKTYYLDPNSNAMVIGHRYIDNVWYYFDASGALMTTGTWVATADGVKYQMGDGTYVVAQWVDDFSNGGVRYYMDENGYAVGGFNTIDGTLYYFDPVSHALLRGWLTIDGNVYCTAADGAILTGWQYIDGYYYYFDANGVMQTGFVYVGGEYYYLESDGKMITGWFTSPSTGYVYYFTADGDMTTGWLELDGEWYFFEDNTEKHYGAMQTGWHVSSASGYTYYLGNDGKMLKGWQEIDGDTYYFLPEDESYEGMMFTGQQEIDGVTYVFADDGKLIVDKTHAVTWDESDIYVITTEQDPANITEGASFSFKVEVKAGYVVNAVIVNSEILVADQGVYTVENVTSDFKILVITYQTETVTYHKVSFLDYDGRIIDIQYIEKGMAAIAPESPVRSGYTFTGWNGSFDSVMSDTEITAVYEQNAVDTPVAEHGTLKIEVSGGKGFTITVDNGDARAQGTYYVNSKMPIGSYVTVEAIALDGSEFLGWVKPSNGKILSTDTTYSFYTGGNDDIKALYKTDVEGANYVVFKNAKTGQYFDMQYYAAGDTIVFPDDPEYFGYDFAGWDHSEEEIQAKLSNGEDVLVSATWTVRPVYVGITVNGGSITASTAPNEDGKYLSGRSITIEAAAPAEGMKFAYWVDENGDIKSYSSSYTFYLCDDKELTAVYVGEEEMVSQEVLVYVESFEGKDIYGTFIYSWSVPEAENSLTYQASGIVAVDKEYYQADMLYHGTTDSNVKDRSVSAPHNKATGSYSWTGYIDSGETWVAMAWVQYTDSDGNTHIEYSDLFEVTKA